MQVHKTAQRRAAIGIALELALAASAARPGDRWLQASRALRQGSPPAGVRRTDTTKSPFPRASRETAR
jgi:hypothetical protein